MPKPLTASDVARYLLARQDPATEPISNKKLQKLLYLAQGMALAMLHRSLWDTEPLGARVTAYREGPVVPDLWREYKAAKWRPLHVPVDVDLDVYDPTLRAVMDHVLTEYGAMTADELTKVTHHHAPWANTWKRAQAGGYDVIPEPELAEFFTVLLAGPDDPRNLSSRELSHVMRAKPEWVEEEARAKQEVAAGQGLRLSELRRFLGL